MHCDLSDEQKIKINEWQALVLSLFNDLGKVEPVIKGGAVLMQPDILYCAVASWILDESRHAAFHKCNGLEAHKSASYFMYWFVRLKPVQTYSTGEISDPRFTMTNEIFAVIYACRMLNIRFSAITSSKLYGDLLYMLRYRKFTAESMFPMMRLLEISARSGILSSY